mgnify:CR=1 FL=1
MLEIISEGIVIIEKKNMRQKLYYFCVNLYKSKKMKKGLQIPGAPAPIGPYSQAILTNGTLYVSGQIPLNPKTGELVNDSIEESTRQVMSNILSLLQEANMDTDNIVKCSIFLKDLNNFQIVNKIYAEYFRSTPPARETVQVVRLPMDVDVEISCIAVSS